MNTLLEVISHFTGGFASGSFCIPHKAAKNCHRKNYWISSGVFPFLIVSVLVDWLIIPNHTEFIKDADRNTLKIMCRLSSL